MELHLSKRRRKGEEGEEGEEESGKGDKEDEYTPLSTIFGHQTPTKTAKKFTK